jgi:hypothetical protein
MAENLTVEILRQIRDEIVTTRTDLGGRIDTLGAHLGGRIDNVGGRVDSLGARVDRVEAVLLDLAEQQRFVVRHLRAPTTRDRDIEEDVDDLRTRVDAIEKRLG